MGQHTRGGSTRLQRGGTQTRGEPTGLQRGGLRTRGWPTELQRGGPRISVSNDIYNNISLWFISLKVHFTFEQKLIFLCYIVSGYCQHSTIVRTSSISVHTVSEQY
jgi:hypothetical protein